MQTVRRSTGLTTITTSITTTIPLNFAVSERDLHSFASMRDSLHSAQLQGPNVGCSTLINASKISNANTTNLYRAYFRSLGQSLDYKTSCLHLQRNSGILKPWVLHNSKHRPRSRALYSNSDESDSPQGSPATRESESYSDEGGGEIPQLESQGVEDEGKKPGAGVPQTKCRLQRRRGASVLGQCNLDLLSVPGIGPRNMQKLVDKGIGRVAELKQLYRDKFLGDTSEKMVEFLRNSIGIIHKHHAESITSYIKESVDEELKEESPQDGQRTSQKKRLTFCVEGNISVGKTTFLQRIANETLELRDLVEVVPEPISKWQDIGPDHFNILDAFYAEPQRYAYTFQNYVFVTRVMQERESAGGLKPLRLMERSVFSDRMVFVRAVHEAKWMNEMEISIYDSWFDPVVSVLPGLVPDGFIYLRASPDTCHRRLQLRKRAEENSVTLEYLQGLHEKHEHWLFPTESGNHGVLSVSQLPLDMDRTLHPYIRDRIFYLQGEHVHASIQKVPALVLDCEPNIDFNRDIEAKQEYARQVAEFFEFVKRKKEIQPPDKDESTKNSKKVRLPQTGGLLGPDGNLLQPSQLNSLDFRRAVSFLSN
eukprot:Gb_04620 [translate_table: standard]